MRTLFERIPVRPPLLFLCPGVGAAFGEERRRSRPTFCCGYRPLEYDPIRAEILRRKEFTNLQALR